MCRCLIDLCKECFFGEWKHRLHYNGQHNLIPIDPRIEYRCYSNWSCDICNTKGTHGSQLWVLFHCKQCQVDICSNCFKGHTHHLHPHGLIREKKSTNSLLNCSHCERRLANNEAHYSCPFIECTFHLCEQCFKTPPKPHPLHPNHILQCSKSDQVYPETGGIWHCDNCSETHSQTTPLTSNDEMHHCKICQYDLCRSCYRYTPTPPSPWLQAQPLSQQYNYLASMDQYKRPLVQRTSLNFIPSPATSLPAVGICRMCGLATARLTTVHNGRAHSEPLYCNDCGRTVMETRDKCYKCGLIPDDMLAVN